MQLLENNYYYFNNRLQYSLRVLHCNETHGVHGFTES